MLSLNTSLVSESGKEVTILKHIGSGGRTDVYAVSEGNNLKALKWYRRADDPMSQKILANIRALSQIPAPDSHMLWVEDVFVSDDAFGYTMPILPNSFIPLYKILLQPGYYSGIIACQTALNYVSAMRRTHEQGLLFCTVDGDSNCYFDPETGNLRITDCEMITLFTSDPLPIYPNGRYGAPELITQKTKPNRLSNLYSLALILFLILFRGHPLEGKATMAPIMTPSVERHIYGESPLFIFDANSNTNAPIPEIHRNVTQYWIDAPDYLKAIFEKAFSQEALHNPNMRPSECDFEEILLRYMNDLKKN